MRRDSPLYVAAPTAPTGAPSRLVIERPPEGPARGEHAWPPWAIFALGATLVALTVVYYVLRLRGRKTP